MRFSHSFLDEIRGRLPVSEVVSRCVRLKRRGREFVGLSPFKAEKTPSFTVNDEKGFYHCFATGKHGDIFTFLIETEGLTFPEAVERLAGEAGLEVPKAGPEDRRREAERAGLHDALELAAAFFEAQLTGAQGPEARDYLDRRGVTAHTRESFRIGYAPRSRAELKQYLAGKGIAQELMIAAGLLIAGDDIPVSYDRFRHRIMFPITDLSGRVIAFGGRALDAAHPAKYLNSPETRLFHKGSVLFNAGRARRPAHERSAILVVEGYMDVVALSQAGFPHAVAPLGTALTEDQLRLLWRLAPEPTLCFDGDEAGRKAAQRAAETAMSHLRAGYSLRVAWLPPGQDPDDLVAAEGPAAMTDVVASAQSLADVLWDKQLEAGPLDTPERRAAFEDRLEAEVAAIRDEKVRRHYRAEISARLERLWSAPARTNRGRRQPPPGRRGDRSRGWAGETWEAGQRHRAPASASLNTSALVARRPPPLPAREALLVRILLNHPWLVEEEAEEISAIALQGRPASELIGAILTIVSNAGPLDSASLQDQLRTKGLGPQIARIDQVLTHRSDWFADVGSAPEDVRIGWRHALARQNKALGLQRELAEAERALLDEATDANLERLRATLTELERLEGSEAGLEGFGDASGRPPSAMS